MKKLTNDFGNIIADNQNSLSAGAKSTITLFYQIPILL